MGSDRGGGESSTTTTTRQELTPAELEAQEIRLEQLRQTAQPTTDLQLQLMNLSGLLARGEDLPNNLSPLTEGISAEAIGTQASEFGRRAMPGFQQFGLAESGSAARSISESIANQLLLPVEQYNQQTLLNLLNLGAGGQASLQGGISSPLSQSFAGGRSSTTVGTQTLPGTSRISGIAGGAASGAMAGSAWGPWGAGVGGVLGGIGGAF